MNRLPPLPRLILLLGILVVGLPAVALAQWAAQPGARVRNEFGPSNGTSATVCRGACGAGCPSSCAAGVAYECTAEDGLRRVRTYRCGTHPGCREHDDCLDRCLQENARGFDCQTRCHSEAIERYGFEDATSWAGGGGPYEGEAITFEYTRDAPSSPEPGFRCPDGSRRECADGSARCVATDGSTVDPVFDSYSSPGPDAMRVSGFRAGPLCGDHVCEQSSDIQVDGADSCDGAAGAAACTRYGIEFDYRNADPAQPLECATSTDTGESDFVGDLIKRGLDSIPQQGIDSGTEQGQGMSALLGALQKVVAGAESPEDVDVSMAPLGPDGRPIESQRVGSRATDTPPPVPRSVDIPAESGHLLVPMYRLLDGSSNGSLVVQDVRCSHRGTPVLEASFRLHVSGR